VKDTRQGLQSILIVSVSLVMTIGSIITAIAENKGSGISNSGTAPPASNTPISQSTSPPQTAPSATNFFVLPSQPPATPTTIPPTKTLTPFTVSVNCNPPQSWGPYFVQYGNSLEELALRYNLTPNELKAANCLESDFLPPGSIIFVPNKTPTSTAPVSISCGHPADWIQYIIIKDDTLYSLGLAYGVSDFQLQQANCMGTSTLIIIGTKLWVPNVPTKTPTTAPTATSP
jgi:LysM repeat protein